MKQRNKNKSKIYIQIENFTNSLSSTERKTKWTNNNNSGSKYAITGMTENYFALKILWIHSSFWLTFNWWITFISEKDTRLATDAKRSDCSWRLRRGCQRLVCFLRNRGQSFGRVLIGSKFRYRQTMLDHSHSNNCVERGDAKNGLHLFCSGK